MEISGCLQHKQPALTALERKRGGVTDSGQKYKKNYKGETERVSERKREREIVYMTVQRRH